MTDNKKITDKQYDVMGIGNALVDILSYETDAFLDDLAAQGIRKGDMTLIDTNTAHKIFDKTGQSTMMSGGSAANTIATIASFGGKTAFAGKTGDDEFGDAFRHDLKAQKIAYKTPVAKGEVTGTSQVVITPDKERTMMTQLGVNEKFGPKDIDEAEIAKAKTIFLEGYLFDRPDAKDAFMKAAKAANNSDTKVALTLSSVFSVNAHRDDFIALTQNHVDIVFGNEKELKALTLKDDFEDAVNAAKDMCETVVITRGSKGALIIDQGKRYDIAPVPVKDLVDTTGAGDAFAGGVLYGLSQGMSPDKAGSLGAQAASLTISHIGARSIDRDFSTLKPA